MLPDTLPAGEKQHFVAMLSSLTVMRQQEVTPTEAIQTDEGETIRQGEGPGEQQVTEEEGELSTSTKISQGLLTGNMS